MKTILFFLFLPLCIWGQSQSTIDFVGGVGYSFPNFNVTAPDIPDFQGRFNFRFGVNYNRRIGKQLWLKTGARFARVGYKTGKLTNLRWGSENENGVWVPDPTLPRESQSFNDYLFVDIPLAIRYEFGKKKLRPFAELGVSPYIFVTRISKKVTDLETSTKILRNIGGFRNFHLTGQLSFGLDYTLNEKWIFFGQPIFRYHFTGLTQGSQERLYSIGLEFGARLQLN